MTHIHTDKAPAAIGPYSQAVSHGNLVFTSGQIPLDSVSGKLVGTGIEEQAEQVMKNLLAVLDAAALARKWSSRRPASSPIWRISRRSTRFTANISSRTRPEAALPCGSSRWRCVWK